MVNQETVAYTKDNQNPGEKYDYNNIKWQNTTCVVNSDLVRDGIHWGLTGLSVLGTEKPAAAGQRLALSIVNNEVFFPLLPLLPYAFANGFHSNLNK